jgi:hypothetical protein
LARHWPWMVLDVALHPPHFHSLLVIENDHHQPSTHVVLPAAVVFVVVVVAVAAVAVAAVAVAVADEVAVVVAAVDGNLTLRVWMSTATSVLGSPP